MWHDTFDRVERNSGDAKITCEKRKQDVRKGEIRGDDGRDGGSTGNRDAEAVEEPQRKTNGRNWKRT